MKKYNKTLLVLSLLLVGCEGAGTSSGKPIISILNPNGSESITSETISNSENASSDAIISEEISSSESISSVVSSNEELSSSKLSSSIESVSNSLNSEENNSSFNDPVVEQYYKSIDFNSTGKTLMASLEKLLDSTDNTSFTYSSMFNVFSKTDIDPNNPNSNKMLSFYSGTPADRSSMNREHVWPDSRGGFLVEDDPHCIRPTISSENSSRGNSFYNENSSWDPATFNNEKYRGIAARIVFYCAVKAYTEGLYLVDKNNDPQLSSTNSVTKKKWNPTMGKLSTLLEWNLEYDIDVTETIRNDVLYEEYNHCRNPFIDNRDLACQIWGDESDATRKVCNK